MQETLYFLQVFAIHLLCAAVGIANVVSTAWCCNWLKGPLGYWEELALELVLAVALWAIWFKGDWYQNASMFTGLGAGVLLVLAWRMYERK
jgi:hypothetical protein